jgi:hypothetical protein
MKKATNSAGPARHTARRSPSGAEGRASATNEKERPVPNGQALLSAMICRYTTVASSSSTTGVISQSQSAFHRPM